MAIEFGRDVCGRLAIAEDREWLVTNGIGGYGCGTVAGILTRHYHGLLNAALNPPLDRTLLLTKLDETVIYGDQTTTLSCDRWSDHSVTSQGYRYLEQFGLEGTVPTWYYVIRDALLIKRIWMEQGANTTYVQYHLKRATDTVQLSLRSMINYRNHHHSTRGRGWQMTIQPQPRGIWVKPNERATTFYIVSDRGTCTPAHQWYFSYLLTKEQYRGIDPYDDHLHGATFAVELSVGETLTLAATTETPEALEFDGALARQHRHEQTLLDRWRSAPYLTARQAPGWIEPLVLAADQFVVARSVAGEVGKTVIAGYPWFGDWGRDTMIALPGLAIATGRPEIARPILRTYASYIDQGMLPNAFPEGGTVPGYNTVDAVLWFFEAIRLYQAASADVALLHELFPALVDIVEWHQRGTRHNIHLDTDGLIYAGEAGLQLTWMDAKVDDWVVTPRIGKPVEINALWYNTLLTLAQLADKLGGDGGPYRQMAAHTREGFQRFWNDDLGYCYDLIDGPEGDDDSLRPNQIFAIALPAQDYLLPGAVSNAHPPESLGPPLLNADQQKAVVDTVAQQLLTSHGLRSLAAHHPDYRGRYRGDRIRRDGAYHQGTVWAWLIGPFIQAHLRVYRNPATAMTFLTPLANHLRDGCVGTLSEIFDGDAPFAPRGAFAQAWSVAEVLRSWNAISQCVSQSRSDI